MSISFLAILLAGAVSGGFINGLAGFGTALFALGFWLQVMPPQQAVAVAVVLSVTTGLQGLWVVRHSLAGKPRRTLRFLLPALAGVPLGTAALAVLDAGTLKLVIASFLILYGGFFTLRRSLPKFDRPTPVMDSVVGLAGGILGGAASLSGALPTMWCAMRPWPKEETRAVLQPFNVLVLALAAATYAWTGAYTRETLVFVAIALPAAVLAAQGGIAVFKRLDDGLFRRLLIALMFLSGALLALRELF